MIRRIAAGILILSVLPVAPSEPLSAATTLKLATLVPDGSVWDKVLKEMGSEWVSRTQGRVQLRIYPGGVAGDEPDVVRKMRIGQLHAAAVTVTGLVEIDPYFKVFTIPDFFASYDELFFVLERLEPVLSERLRAKGFAFLNWGHGGWVHVFSKHPIRDFEDLKRQKLFVWAGDDERVQWWKRNGFQPVPLAATDIMTGLQTGMIEMVPTTPLAALNFQWFRQTPYMHDKGLAPLVGATVVTNRSWGKISEDDRSALLTAAREAERRLETEVPRQDRIAVTEMEKRGLEVTSSVDDREWRTTAEELALTLRGELVPKEIFDLAVKERDAFRRQAPRASP